MNDTSNETYEVDDKCVVWSRNTSKGAIGKIGWVTMVKDGVPYFTLDSFPKQMGAGVYNATRYKFYKKYINVKSMTRDF